MSYQVRDAALWEVSAPDVSASVPDIAGDVSLPSGSVVVPAVGVGGEMPSTSDAPSASEDVPSVDLAGKVPGIPSVEGEMPSVDLAGKAPGMPSVEGDMPSAVNSSVTATDVKVEGGDAPLTAGLPAGAVAAVGDIDAAVGLSGDKQDAEVRSKCGAPWFVVWFADAGAAGRRIHRCYVVRTRSQTPPAAAAVAAALFSSCRLCRDPASRLGAQTVVGSLYPSRIRHCCLCVWTAT